MKQILFILFVAITSMNILSAADKMVNAEKLPELAKMNAVLQDPALTILGAIEKPETYVLKLIAKSPQGSQLMLGYLDKSTSALYLGMGYMKDGHPIIYPQDANAIKEGVYFTYGTGSKEIYLVTDPECPYCSKFSKAAEGQLGDYTVHVIFFPLSFHKKSPAMIEWIMQGKDDAQKKKRYDEIMLKGSTKYSELHKDPKTPFVYSAEVQKQIDKGTRATLELNVRGTPMLFDATFNPLPMEQVIKVPKK